VSDSDHAATILDRFRLRPKTNPDKNNPNPALRNRRLCGLTILWNLQPDAFDRWNDGWFYNSDNGSTYRVAAQLKSNDERVARIYVGVSLFGKTKVLARVPHGTSAGWCRVRETRRV
jgi:hypothetical protein